MGVLPWPVLTTLQILCFKSVLSTIPYGNQPKLLTENGHLLIVAAMDKNLTLRTTGNGYVNLNGDNLLHITQMAKRASDTVTRFQANVQTNIQTRLNSLDRQIFGPQGLSEKILSLERNVLIGNVSSIPTGGQRPPPPRPSFNVRINRLNNRLRTVENQLRNLRNLLTVDECLSNPCRNGGTCQDLYNRFVCICPDNWQGLFCDEDVNECAEFAGEDWGCRNGATCINKPGSYECVCPDTYFGKHCTLRTNDCSNANSGRLCDHGICVNQGGNGRGFACICDEGWTQDSGHLCTVDIDECQAKRYPCSHDPYVQCINLPGSYHCGFCPPGFTGNGFQCTDINECEVNNGGCGLGVSCHNTRGSRVCGACPPGFSGDGVICTPLTGGACAINNGGCAPVAQCFQNAGIVICRCPNGYAGDGYGPNGCSPSAAAEYNNPCLSRPCKNGGTCTRVGTKAVCTCHSYFTGSDCSNPVSSLCTPNPCQNNGTCEVFGFLGVDRVNCVCQPGFRGAHCEESASDCGGVLTQDTGVIQVPAGNDYQLFEGQVCTWIIIVLPDKVVEITFQEMTFDPQRSCADNQLKLLGRAGSDDPQFTFCYQQSTAQPAHPPITFASNRAIIQFKATTGVNKNHFKLTWRAIAPMCGRTLQLIAGSTGTISSPPSGPQNLAPNQKCEWRLLAPPGKRIQLLFNTLELQPSSDCSKNYVKVQEYEDGEPTSLLAKFCNSSSPAPIVTRFPAAYIFSTESSLFRVTYSVIEGCGGVLTKPSGSISPELSSAGTYLNEQDCEWRIQLPLGDKIKIVFTAFDLEDIDPCDDYVEVRDGPTDQSPVVGRWCGTTIPPPYVSSSNTLTILFHSDFIARGYGFYISYETVCGGEFTGPSGEIRSPNYPKPYSAEHNCVYLISSPSGTAIKLAFQDFELEQLDEECSFDRVEIRDGHTDSSKLIGTYCGTEKPPPVLSTFNYLYISFTSDSSHHLRGFIANYSTVDITCGGILKENSGSITSPQNEDGYLPDSNCQWLIVAPPGWSIQLSFLSFHLEHSNECSMDSVEVYENSTYNTEGYLIGRFCGLKIPPPTTSSSDLVTIRFRSDDSVHRDGFVLQYTMIDKSKVCGGTYRSISGTIETPNYPGNYPYNKECIWIIHVPQGQQIKLTFAVFQLEEDTDSTCDFDSLEIRNGLLETSPLVGKYCGSNTPPDVISLTNGLWLHFSSDSNENQMGFSLSWDATATGCGGTLTGQSGSIYSPNYPQPYARNAKCFFKVAISHGSRVRLHIVDVDLETHPKCHIDFIEVFDGKNDHSKSLGKFCAPNHPESLLSSENIVFITFESDNSISGRGFHLKYSTECNITLRSHYGVLESPNYPNNYGPLTNCMWIIQAPKGNKVNLTFVQFELEDVSVRNICNFDYLEISEGTKNQTPSNILGRFCGSELPKPISSQLDQVYIHFVTDHITQSSGFRLEWVISGCGGVYRNRPGPITSPNYPNGYPHEVECEWRIIAPWDMSIQINVTDFQLEDSSNCMFDYLAIFGGEDDSAPVLLKACHSQKSGMVVTTSGSNALIRFRSDHSLSGRGFSASWSFVDSKCGGKFTAPFGTIHSHNYPKNYDNRDDCEWLIQVPPSNLVNLTFTDFDVEASFNNLTTDYVNVYDGDSIRSPLLLSHNGNDLPEPPYVVSTGNSLLVRHTADGSVSAKGFSAQYAVACGARILAKGTGTFSLDPIVGAGSPFAQEDYTANCTWYIIAENPEDKLSLTFTYLDVSPNIENNDTHCSYNYVAVYEGDNTNGTVVSRICGTKIPPPIYSHGSALTVEAVSIFGFRSHLGQFSAMYSTYLTACGGELTSEHGTIASPLYPESYPGDVDCEWVIKASVGNKVTLTFTSFDVEQTDYCNDDYVEIREGASNGTLQGVFCGSNLPNNITAANTLWVRFRSHNLNSAKGFMAEYSLVHGVALSGTSGQIASPQYPTPYVQAGEFQWTISVSPYKSIKITFSDFYMDKYQENMCIHFFKVIDGPYTKDDSPSSLELLNTCGAEIPSPIVSKSNLVTVVFENSPWTHGSYFLLNWEEVSRSPTSSTATTTEEEENLGCGQLVHVGSIENNNSATISSPGYPQPYGLDQQCTWIIDTSIGFHLELKFTAMDLEEFDECEADFVKVFKADTSVDTSKGWTAMSSNLCLPNSTSLKLIGSNRMKLYFQTDSSEEKSGFSAKVTSVCGGELTDSSGELDTRTIPSTWGKIACDWTITVRSGRTIQFSFDSFDLPSANDGVCHDNYIMFRDGAYKDSPPLGNGIYCGKESPSVPNTMSNRAFISYATKAGAPGLVLKYQEMDYSCNYRIDLVGQTPQFIRTPNYPQSPSTSHITCTWLVTAPPGESVKLDFLTRFDLKYSKNCKIEFLEIYDGGTEMAYKLGRYCGHTPAPISSQGNHLLLKYFTDADVPNNGFEARVSVATCGGSVLDFGKVILRSPHYPERYPPNLNCTWRFVTYGEDYQITFNVSDLSLGNDDEDVDCTSAKDYIEVRNIDSDTKSVIGQPTKLCGKMLPGVNSTSLIPPSVSTEVHIFFHSGPKEPYETKRGFFITVISTPQNCKKVINAESGEIVSPGYPNPKQQYFYFKMCSWLITVPKGRIVSLKFLDYDLDPTVDSFWTNYKLALYGSGGTHIRSFSTDEPLIGQTVDSITNVLSLRYIDKPSGAHKGFKAQFFSTKPAICGAELKGSGTVSFSPANLNLSAYFCEWTYSQDSSLSAPDSHFTFTVILSGTLNANDSDSNCPLFAARSSDSILVHNKRFTTSEWNGFGKVLGNVCGKNLENFTVRSPYPQLTVLARKRAPFVSPLKEAAVPSVASFTISYKTDPCGGLIGSSNVTITSPGFPGQYPANMDCAWLVVTRPNSKVQVRFDTIDLDADCDTDFLQLYNGETQLHPHLTAKMCGNNVPKVITSQGNKVLVEFHSGPVSPSKRRQGFKLTLTEDISGCGGLYHAESGSIQSPNYGNGDYPNNAECEWVIILPPGFHAGISLQFSLETSKDCLNDFVQVFEQHNDQWIQIGDNYCGRTSPNGIKTKNNKFKVFFRSNPSITSDGFKLSWTNLCGGEFEVTGSGSIVSPKYPKAYTNNLNCNYTLLASGKVIYGEFEDFDVEQALSADGNKCRFDNVTLHTYSMSPFSGFIRPWMVRSNTFPRPMRAKEMTVCGSDIPEPVFSYGRFNLMFATDEWVTRKGFHFKYSLATCGSNITSPEVIKSPSYTLNFLNCTWFITAPADKIVVIKIKKMFSNGFSANCLRIGFQMFNGYDIRNSSNVIDTVCSSYYASTSQKRRFYSAGNTMAIHYYSNSRLKLNFEAAIGFTYGEKHKCGGTLQLADLVKPYVLKAPDVNNDGHYEPFLACDWLLLAPQSHQIRAVFDRVDIQNCSNPINTHDFSTCSCDYLEVRDGDNELSPQILRTCGSTISHPEAISTMGKLLIHFSSDGDTELFGFQITITTFISPCGETVRNATTEVQVLHSPGYPGQDSEASVSCMWLIAPLPRGSGKISIHITDLDLPEPCTLNYLEFREKPIAELNSLIGFMGAPTKLCGNRTVDLVFNTVYRKLQLSYVRNRGSNHKGFSLEYKVKGCNENYTTPSGKIISPSFSGSLETTCYILVQVPQSNSTLSLYFNSLLCTDHGKMTMYDGTSDQAKEIGSFCPLQRRPNPIFTNGPAMFIKFEYRRSFARYDFTYTSTDQGRGCGGSFKEMSGSFTSPLYPAEYKKDSSCRWDISVPHGMRIVLIFSYFDIGPLHTCNTNYLQIFDVSTSTGTETLHAKYCGQETPAEVQTIGETAFVRYVTTSHNNGTGWAIHWHTSHSAIG